MRKDREKKRYIIIVTSLLAASLLFAEVSFAQERVGLVKTAWRKFLNVFRKPAAKETHKPEAEPRKSALAELSEEELRERIRRLLEISPEIADFIPELKLSRDEEGNIIKVEYEKRGTLKNIEELDKETLIRIHNRVNNERVRIQTERIQQQLQAAQAAQKIPTPPPVHTPPVPPKTHTPPPSPPKVPTPPPSPPAQHRR